MKTLVMKTYFHGKGTKFQIAVPVTTSAPSLQAHSQTERGYSQSSDCSIAGSLKLTIFLEIVKE